jgi:hypothetical protein
MKRDKVNQWMAYLLCFPPSSGQLTFARSFLFISNTSRRHTVEEQVHQEQVLPEQPCDAFIDECMKWKGNVTRKMRKEKRWKVNPKVSWLVLWTSRPLGQWLTFPFLIIAPSKSAFIIVYLFISWTSDPRNLSVRRLLRNKQRDNQ